MVMLMPAVAAVVVVMVVFCQVVVPGSIAQIAAGKQKRAERHNHQRADQIDAGKADTLQAVQGGHRRQVQQRSGGQHTQTNRHRDPDRNQSHQHRHDAARAERGDDPQPKCQQVSPDIF